MFFRYMISVLCLIVVTVSPIAASEKPIKPTGKDKCPVCGMFVSKYTDFLAQIIFKDGSYAMFDGPKDMFKYYLNLKVYNPSKTKADISSVYVNDYYTISPVDGLKAYFVIGSDVTGPMGRELIPFAKEADAKEFMKDHNGKALVRFNEVTSVMLKEID
ncbi:MAG: nitrous oxide reductase accessory protein NosL [Dissulfurispiraceae bacterium]